MKPTFSEPNVLTTNGAASAIGRPVRVSTTFDTTHCHFASCMRAMSASSPKSNSWLPSVARSSPAALSAATICSPLNTLEATDGDRKSPARTTNGIRPARPSGCFSVATRARPPRPSIGSVEYTSLICRNVTGAPLRGCAASS